MIRTVASLALVAATLAATAPLALAQNENQSQGTAIVTVVPKQENAPAPNISEQSIHVEVNGKQSQITTWQPLRAAQSPVELVLLIDDGARTSLGSQFDDIQHFIQSLPPNVKITLAYMENGRAALSGPLSADHSKALQQIHIPNGLRGQSASPYFCLSDLAKNWPSDDRSARRQVIMVTDGVDYYHLQFDPDDPYVQAAVQDSVRAHIVVSSIYWRNAGRLDRSGYENNAGQSLLAVVADSTGGTSYWIGTGNPVSLSPYFEDVSRRLNNQYELGFASPISGKPEMATLKVKIEEHDVKVTSPQKTWIGPGEVARQ